MTLPEHLGGHGGYTNMDLHVFDFLVKKYAVKSFLDIGCGPGGMLKLANSAGLRNKGIDGDYTLNFDGFDVLIHDFTKGPVVIEESFDLGWCVEVLEHIEEEYLDNLRTTFQRCDHLWITHALPGQIGWHHVNCQDASYWRGVFNRWGFRSSRNDNLMIRSRSGMKYSRRTGMLLHRL